MSTMETQEVATPPAEADVRADMTVPLTELQKYKLEALDGRVHALVDPVRDALTKKYQQLLQQELKAFMSTHPGIICAQQERDAYVNSVLDDVEAQLPEGYAVVLLSHELGEAQARYNPEQRGKRITAG